MLTPTFIMVIAGFFLAIVVSITLDFSRFSVAFLFAMLGVYVFMSAIQFIITPETSASYEITVNEKSFKTSDFKTKEDGSIEFTADNGTTIRASDYEIRNLNQKTEEMKK